MSTAADSPSKRSRSTATGRASLADTFARCKREGRPAFIPYITAGFPELHSTVDLLLALQTGGADIIELGMPFSDPLADGPTIQKSSFDALQNGVKMRHCFEFVEQARAKGLTVPVVLMGYYNPFQSFGEEKLAQRCAEVGIDGFIVVDLPPDDAETFAGACNKHNLSLVPLIAPTSTDDRLALLAKLASGYVYLVSLTGVTGARTDLPENLPKLIERAKKVFTVPLAVGFGLSTPEHVKRVYEAGGDGAVVGSAIINEIRAHPKADAAAQVKGLEEYVKRMTALVKPSGASTSS